MKITEKILSTLRKTIDEYEEQLDADIGLDKKHDM